MNYPDDINQYNNHPGSPMFDDSGIESAHTKKIEEVEGNIELVAEIISELPAEKYVEMVRIVMHSLGGLGYLAMSQLNDSDCDAFQCLLAKSREDLPADAQSIIEFAISEYAMEDLLECWGEG